MKIQNRLFRAARPTPPPPPPPAPKPKPRPAPAAVRDELSTGRGSALRRDAAAMLGNGYAAPAATRVAPAAKAQADGGDHFTEEQLERIAGNVESPDDALLLAQGVIPGDVGELEAQGIDSEWIDDLPQDAQDELIAEIFQRRPHLFISPGQDGGLSPDQQEEVGAALASSLESGALSEEDAIAVAGSLGEHGPLLLMHSVAGESDVAERLADAMFESDVPGAQAAAAVHYVQTPGLWEEKLSDSGDQATAFIALSQAIESGAIDHVAEHDSALYSELYTDLVDSAMTVFTESKPGMLQLLMNEELHERDQAATQAFFENVLFNPEAVSALESAGWSEEDIRTGTEETIRRFTDDSLALAGVPGGEAQYPGGAVAVGRQLGTLFGLLESAADSAIEAGRGGSGFETFAKDVAFGASAALLAAVVTNPAFAAAGGIVLGALGAQVPTGGELSYEEAKQALQAQLGGASNLEAGEQAYRQLTAGLGALLNEAEGPLYEAVNGLLHGVNIGSDLILDYGD